MTPRKLDTLKPANNSARVPALVSNLRFMAGIWSTWDADRQRRVLPGRFNTELRYALEIVSPVREHRYHTATPLDTLDRILCVLGDLRHPDKGGRDWTYQLDRLGTLCALYLETTGS